MQNDVVLLLGRWMDLRERLALVRTIGDRADPARVAAIEEEIVEIQMALSARFAKLPA